MTYHRKRQFQACFKMQIHHSLPFQASRPSPYLFWKWESDCQLHQDILTFDDFIAITNNYCLLLLRLRVPVRVCLHEFFSLLENCWKISIQKFNWPGGLELEYWYILCMKLNKVLFSLYIKAHKGLLTNKFSKQGFSTKFILFL